MKLCAVQFHPRTDDLALDAIRSVREFVDAVLVIDTHKEPGYDFSREVAAAAPAPLLVHRYRELVEERDTEETQRNDGLDIATTYGFDWALTLDPDERMRLAPGFDLRAYLATSTASLVLAPHRTTIYAKERIMSLPRRGSWRGVTHAWYDAKGDVVKLKGFTFDEIPKTGDDLERKREWVTKRLNRQVKEHPTDGRSWAYLGHTYLEQGMIAPADDAYFHALQCEQSIEDAGWIHYSLAFCQLLSGRPQVALVTCGRGLCICPWMCELHYMQARSALELERRREAIAFAMNAITHGKFRGSWSCYERIAFNDLIAQYEGPFEIIAAAMSKADAVAVLEVAKEAKEAREALGT